MSALGDFEPVAEGTADDHSRILMSTRSSGEILLTPLAGIPKRELLVWEDDALRESLLRGLAGTSSLE